MWVLKIETGDQNTILAKLAKDSQVSFTGYPLSYRKRTDKLLVQVCGFIDRSENSNKLQSAMRQLFEEVHINNNFVVALLAVPLWLEVLYNPYIIFLKPASYASNGSEILELGSWHRGPLMQIVKIFKQRYNSKVLMLAQQKVSNLSLISIHPDLTEKQRQALGLAIENGYYQFPKKITLKELARRMKCSFSTYQAHLSKAESRFIPAMFNTMR